MAGTANITRRGALSSLSIAMLGMFAAGSLAAVKPPTAREEFAAAWAAFGPLQRKFIYDQLYAYSKGEPNVLNRTAEYTFEEWASDIPQWERDMIGRAFHSPDIRNY